MANPKFNRERAAKALADAELSSDKTSCDRHGITRRTLDRYRSRMASDPELSELFRVQLGQRTAQLQAKRERGELRWRLDTQKALASIAKRVAELAQSCTDIDLLSKAFARMGEPEYTSEMLNGTAAESPSKAPADRGAEVDTGEADNQSSDAPTIQ